MGIRGDSGHRPPTEEEHAMSSAHGETKDASVQLASKSDVGRVRQANEDSCGSFDRDDGTRLLVVADGMGGHRGGATASQTAIATIGEIFDGQASSRPSKMLSRAIETANERVWEMAQANAELEGMGTTVVALHLDAKRRGTVAHVGDSRAYRYRKGRLEPLTTDHSLVADMQRRGLLSADEAAAHPRRNEILRSVGVLPDVEVEIDDVEVLGGDRFVLCSDGLSGVVNDEEIAAIVQTHSPGEAVDALIDLANERGGPDNITVQILAIPTDETEGDPEASSPVELTSVGIEAIEAKRRQRYRIQAVGIVVFIASAVVGAWLLWQALRTPAGAPPPAATRSAPAPPPAPTEPQPKEDRFEVDAPSPRKGIPRDGGTR